MSGQGMDGLRAELERKRKTAHEDFGGRKFVRRGEIDAKRLEQKQREEAEELNAKQRQRVAAGAAAGPSGAGAGGSAAGGRDGKDGKEKDGPAGARYEELPPEEIIRRLRVLGHPAKLFGEDEAGRRARLEVVVRNLALEMDEALGGQQGNDFGQDLALLEAASKRNSMKEAARAAEERERAESRRRAAEGREREAAEAGGGTGGAGADAAAAAADDESFRTLQAFETAAAAVREAREQAAMPIEDKIRSYLKRLCREWEAEQEARPEAIKRSVQGQAATATVNQALRYIQPLFRLLKRRQLPDDLQRALWMIVQCMQARDYLQASDVYVKIAIGNAAWPIGVTMVGIHERSAREKIFATQQAHVMNDEGTRKYLQSVKRLITFAQRKYPTDPSRCLEFNASTFGHSDLDALHAAEASGQHHEHRLLLEAPKHREGSTWSQMMQKAYSGGRTGAAGAEGGAAGPE